MDSQPPTTPIRQLADSMPSSPVSPPNLKCCCGRPDCAYLIHNNDALRSLEQDVKTAAQLGQALLTRHENFMCDAEREREALNATVDQLEREKEELEVKNAKLIEENRNLTHQLEDLNNTVIDSDTYIKSLSATLETTQAELRRLMTLASRTSELESQLMALENEQMQLRGDLATMREDKHSAIQRWRKAERTLNDLNDQVERMERESREERERHVEVVARLERMRGVETELKASAAAKASTASLGRAKGNNHVVSSFVKDILEDNANLQLGIVELRELLGRSNEEVQQLREQMMMHQSMDYDFDTQNGTLHDELAAQISDLSVGPRQPPPQEVRVNVHHHYHAPVRDRVAKPPHLKVRKRRHPVTPSAFATPNSPSPQTPLSLQGLSTGSTILSQTSASIPQSRSRHRWSIRSTDTTTTSSSIPSSPQSAYQASSIFDRLDSYTLDSSRPTSPEPSECDSPMLFERHPRLRSNSRGQSSPSTLQNRKLRNLRNVYSQGSIFPEDQDGDERYDPLDLAPVHHTITEEDEEDSNEHSDKEVPDMKEKDNDDLFERLRRRPKLRRTPSHESVVSITGMDVHILQDWPPYAVFARPFPGMRPPFGIGLPTPKFPQAPSKPVLTATAALAQPIRHVSRGSFEQPKSMLSSTSGPSGSGSNINTPNDRSALGKRVGEWVFGKWGIAPKVSTNLRPPPRRHPHPPHPRPAGVNQPGAIIGLRPPLRAPSNVHAKFLNHDLLKESLRE
ncbi:MAG: hypothetical protein M1834_005708 [Cirrosporium novae-zelandiae]|nr:MAG: hypothetical protein M1834_005708 [Cirrosporium novae-zelandiae]